MSGKIDQSELHKLFGDAIPIEVVDMLWDDANSHLTIGEMRAKIRRFALLRPLGKAKRFCESGRDTITEIYSSLSMFEDDDPIKKAVLEAAHQLSMVDHKLSYLIGACK